MKKNGLGETTMRKYFDNELENEAFNICVGLMVDLIARYGAKVLEKKNEENRNAGTSRIKAYCDKIGVKSVA